MPFMIKLNRNVVRVYLYLDNGHFITVDRIVSKSQTIKIFSDKSMRSR